MQIAEFSPVPHRGSSRELVSSVHGASSVSWLLALVMLLLGTGTVAYTLTPGIRRAAENVGIALRDGTSVEPSTDDRSSSPSPLLRRSSLVVPGAPFNSLVRDPNNPSDGDWFWVGRGGVLYETSVGDRGYPEPITRVDGELVTAPGYDTANGPRLPSEFRTVADPSVPSAPPRVTPRQAYNSLDRLSQFFSTELPEGVQYVERLRQALTTMERLRAGHSPREEQDDQVQGQVVAVSVSFQRDLGELFRIMAKAIQGESYVPPSEPQQFFILTLDEMYSIVRTLEERMPGYRGRWQVKERFDPRAALKRALKRLRESGDWPDSFGGESTPGSEVDQDRDYPQR